MAEPADNENNTRASWPRGAGVIPDALLLVGLASLGYGCWLIAPPLAYIVCGSLILTAALLMARAG